MPRARRLIFDNASYHVMVRGNQKQATFLNKDDFIEYLNILEHYKYKYKFKLYGYCLMPNHVHLILEIKNGSNLQKIMQGLNQTYTTWFNKKYNKVGHLWQGRYKSIIINKDSYMLDCLEYVELNPVRAEISNSPSEYPWSSRKIRLSHRKNNILNTLEL